MEKRKLVFELEPGFSKISSHEIRRAFGLPHSSISVQGLLCAVEDCGDDGLVERRFGDDLWSPIQLAGAVNFLLSHPKTVSVYFITSTPIVESSGKTSDTPEP